MLTGQRDLITDPSIANPMVNYVHNGYERNPDAEFPDNIVGTAAICNTSASHTYGNVMLALEKYILDIFPADTFKTITCTTSLASRQLTHLPRQLVKKEMPTMVLAPRISFGQEDNRFLAHTLMNSRFTNTFGIWGDGSLIPLAMDNRKELYVHGHYNRNVMYVDIVLSFNSFMEQVNWMSFIHNMIPVGHNFFIKAPLELYLPREFCNLLCELATVKVPDDRDTISNYLEYMNSIWFHPITYKLKGGSGSDAFFMYYIAEIDTVVDPPQVGAGIKDGQIRRNFDISFTVRCDFNTIGYFMINSPNIRNRIHITPKDDNAIVPIFTDVIDLNNFQLPVGWSILAFPIFKLGIGENSVSIDPILNQSLRTVIEYHLDMKIPLERFIMIQFRENGNILTNEYYHIDWDTKIMTVSNPDYHRTYRLLIIVSHEYVNEMIKDIYNLK